MNRSRMIIEEYYAAFHRDDHKGMLALLHDEVIHEINQGNREIGIDSFRIFYLVTRENHPDLGVL